MPGSNTSAELIPLEKGPDGKPIYPWEKEPNADVPQANKFNFAGHIRAQGRGVMEILQKAQREHPLTQEGGGKAKTCVLYRMHDEKRETKVVNSPYWTVANGIREVQGYDTIIHYKKLGWIEEDPFKLNDDPKDARIRELEKQISERSNQERRIEELEAKLNAVLEAKTSGKK